MDFLKVKRGEIYFAKLDPVVDSETGKTRPVLVVKNDIGNLYSPTTILAVVTEYSPKKASYPICVAVKKAEGGLVLISATWIPGLRYIFYLRNSQRRRNPAILSTPWLYTAPPGMTTAGTIVFESGRC